MSVESWKLYIVHPPQDEEDILGGHKIAYKNPKIINYIRQNFESQLTCFLEGFFSSYMYISLAPAISLWRSPMLCLRSAMAELWLRCSLETSSAGVKNSKKTSSGTKHPEKIFVGGSTPRGACLRRRRSRFSYAPPELDSSKLWFFCYILIVLLTLKKGGSRTSSSVNPSSSSCLACCMYVCGLYDWGSSSPQAISFLNDASFYLICQCQKISVSSRYSRCLKIAERIFEDEMIVCMTTPCIFMSKITRHNPIQYEGFSSVWIQVDLIILFQIF